MLCRRNKYISRSIDEGTKTTNKDKGETMLTRLAATLLVLLCTIGFFGCSKGNIVNPIQPESRLEKNWGRSFEAAKYNQTLNPEAEKNLAPVEGLDGSSAERIMESYKKGGEQKKEERPSGFGVMTIQQK